MAASTTHQILQGMVPLICQALTTAPIDDQVWLEGLRLLTKPKLCTALTTTSSIWLPLLLKGLDTSSSATVKLAALRLLTEVAETLEPMKSCLVKPLRALRKDKEVSETEEFNLACRRLGLETSNDQEVNAKEPRSAVPPGSTITSPLPPTATRPRDHPRLAEILARNLPFNPRTVQQAWTQSLLSSMNDNSAAWLENLYQATLEACAVPELLINLRLGSSMHVELFQTAFLKCYALIQEDARFKTIVDNALVRLLRDTSLNKDILCVLLELVAFFDKEARELPQVVLDAAKTCALHSFAGDVREPLPAIALWWAEQETFADMTAQNIANLVEVNIRIGAAGYDSAWSSLLWLEDDYGVQPTPMWITQLSHWQEAVDAQDNIDQGGPISTFSSFQTRITCYHALGEFERGYELAQSFFEGLTDDERRKTAYWATAAAWHMGDYETMADYLAFHQSGTSKSLYKAIIDVHHGQYDSAFRHISKAQSLSYDELQTQLDVGPQVALKTLAKTEMLVELQEVIQYRSQPDLRDHLLGVWRERFKRSHADANSWLKRLNVWTLAAPPTANALLHCYLECAKLCESSGMHEAAQKIIGIATPEVTPPGCRVEYTRMRFEWKDAVDCHDTEQMHRLYDRMYSHTNRLIRNAGVDHEALENEGLGLRPLTSVEETSQRERTVLARRFYRMAQWSEALQAADWLKDPDLKVYRYYSLANKLDDTWYNGAYFLAEAAISLFEAHSYRRSDNIAVTTYVVPAIRGLFQAIRCQPTPEKMIKALLRLVTLWFRFGETASVLEEVQQQLEDTPISLWLMAIPQLIARLGTPHKALQGALLRLLKNIASNYPHAVVWPLLTATKTRKVEHERAARVIMDFICSMPGGTSLISQAELVGRELIRTSISMTERWRNIIDRCLPRQDVMEIAWHEIPAMWEEEILKLSEPETPDEELFVQNFGAQLKQIHQTLVRYRSTKSLGLVNSAYGELHKLFGELDTRLHPWRIHTGSTLQLASVAPKLLSIRDCILTVPGKYDPTIKLDDQAFIDSFYPVVHILASKQLPRKLVIRSKTSDLTFLLKGNEDLRGDERIMQLFALVNTLLNHESEAFNRNLHLLPYEVIPLSPSAGLLSWVPNTQQLQAMISANRDKDPKNNLTYLELASLLGYEHDGFDPKHDHPHIDALMEMDRYDKLSSEVKLERLKAAMSHSDQNDLMDVLWNRSPSAEIWIRRRTNFARTIGVGSFVGHIIGLGDRHGSNILVDQLTWSALHIDFGDLFGVAQERALSPEKVPFRLTRMMTNAFGLDGSRGHVVPGSRGTFKQASIVTMEVLRESRSSLLAMLEAFLYDPLLSWTADSAPSDPISDTDFKSSQTNSLVRKGNHPGIKIHPPPAQAVPQSVAPVRAGVTGDSDVYNRIDNSLVAANLDTDSYMAKVSGAAPGMTNRKALQVLAQIERKLVGYNRGSDAPLSVGKQVQELIEEATDLENLAQGYVLGWIPYCPSIYVPHRSYLQPLKQEGKVRSIGVSNFNTTQLEGLLGIAKIKPSVNQIKHHAYNALDNEALLAVVQKHGIIIEAYFSLTPITTSPGGPADAVGQTIADDLTKRYGKDVTVGQTILDWLRSSGIVAVTTSSREERLKEQLAVFQDDFPLLTAEQAKEYELAGPGWTLKLARM